MGINELINKHIVLLDGAMGTMLQKKGLDPGDPPERFNIRNPQAVKEVHTAYLEAGSNIILTNTFGANRLNYSEKEVDELIGAGIQIAKEAISDHEASGRFAALDIGPSGRLMEPFGDLSFEEAVDIFAGMVKAGVKYGADLIFIETMSDLYETKAALLAAKENSSLPIFVSNSYQQSGRLMTGADPLCMITLLEGMGADAVGMNCSMGPEQLSPIVGTYLKYASVPVLVKPNAGLPRNEDGRVVYDITARTFAERTAGFAEKGARILGGCCGTSPEYIRLLAEIVSANISDGRGSAGHTAVSGADVQTPMQNAGGVKASSGREDPGHSTENMISSHMTALDLSEIDISSIPRLSGSTVDELVDSAYDLEDEAEVLRLDTSTCEENEKKFMREAVFEIQSAVKNPLMLTAKDPEALDAGLRIYKGKALIKPADGPAEYLNAINAKVKKYGGVISK